MHEIHGVKRMISIFSNCLELADWGCVYLKRVKAHYQRIRKTEKEMSSTEIVEESVKEETVRLFDGKHKGSLFFPQNPTYFIYRPLSPSSKQSSSLFARLRHSYHFWYYRWIATNGMYCMNKNERFALNALVLLTGFLMVNQLWGILRGLYSYYQAWF